MNKTVGELTIIKNVQLNHDNFILELQSEEQLEALLPGQFVNIQVKDSATTFLRRPISIHDVDYDSNTFTLLIKAVGDGTQHLVQSSVGDKINVVYPLGNGFTRPMSGEKILLVGGGVGIAPMMQMARESKAIGAEVHILLGARSKADHILIEEFQKHGNVYLTTNDGSLGIEGVVTQHDIMTSKHYFDRIYCCGPDPMMHAVARVAKAMNVECEVSLENMMACGFGVCLCCVTKTTKGNKCVCTDGPVFNINDLEWQI